VEPVCAPVSLPSRQCEVNGDLRLDLHGLVVQQKRTITPLPDGIERGWNQQWMAADHLQILDSTLTADNRMQYHTSLNSRLPRKLRILRLQAMNKIAFHHARNPQRSIRRDRRWKRKRIHSRANTVPDRILRAGKAYTAGNTRSGGQLWRKSNVVETGDVGGNRLWHQQVFADHIAGRTSGGVPWRRSSGCRGRRRGDQRGHELQLRQCLGIQQRK